MFWIAFTSLMVLLVILAYQDIKSREISWWLLPLILIIHLISQAKIDHNFWQNTLLNLGFVLLNWTLVSIYFSMKKKKFVNIIDSHLGLGDLLFLVVCAFVFSVPNFLFFLCLGFSTALLFYVLYLKRIKRKEESIPLAGVMALLLALILVLDQFYALQLADNSLFIKYLQG